MEDTPPIVARRIAWADDWPAFVVVLYDPGFGRQITGKPTSVAWSAWEVAAHGECDVLVQGGDDETAPVPLEGEWAPPPDALRYANGSLKWDGCNNFSFDDLEEPNVCLLHSCGISLWDNLRALGACLLEAGREIMGEDCR